MQGKFKFILLTGFIYIISQCIYACAGHFLIEMRGGGIFTPEQHNNITLFAEPGNKITTTAPVTVSGNLPAYLKEGIYYTRIKSKSFLGLAGKIGLGYLTDRRDMSVTFNGFYNNYDKTATCKDAALPYPDEADIYRSKSVGMSIRITAPLVPEASLSPYIAFETIFQQDKIDHSVMDVNLRNTVMIKASAVPTDNPNHCNTAGYASGADPADNATRACPGYGNILKKSKRERYFITTMGAIGTRYKISSDIALSLEYAMHLGFKQHKTENTDLKLNTTEYPHVKHYISTGLHITM